MFSSLSRYYALPTNITAITTAAVLLVGCANNTALNQQAAAPATTSAKAIVAATSNLISDDSSDGDISYRLGAGDKLNIRVFEEENLSGEFEVDSNGVVAFPLIGSVDAKNRSARELEEQLEARLADGYLIDPSVSVEVLTYRPFYILGEVKQPGAYNYVNGITVFKAIALAGGYTYRAKEDHAYVKHVDTPDKEEKVGISEPVVPGDIITIKERYF